MFNKYSYQKQNQIVTQFLVGARKLHEIKEYINTKLLELEHNIFSSEHGYIEKIVSLDHIEFDKCAYCHHDGSILVKITFTAICINPQINDIIECEICENNGIMFSLVGPMPIIIRQNFDDFERVIKKNDVVLVKVVSKQFDVNENIIKVLADFVNYNNNKNKLNQAQNQDEQHSNQN